MKDLKTLSYILSFLLSNSITKMYKEKLFKLLEALEAYLRKDNICVFVGIIENVK